MTDSYKKPLPQGTSLCVFENDNLIFSSQGKWLHPLFDFEQFLITQKAKPQGILSAHDTYIGKAAAVLMVRLGITKMHANTASKLAVEFIQELGKKGFEVEFSYDTLIERLMCKTEEELQNLSDIPQMYELLQKRHERALNR